MKKYTHFLLPPDCKWHFEVKEKDVANAINELETAICAATKLYGLLGQDSSFRSLSRRDGWV